MKAILTTSLGEMWIAQTPSGIVHPPASVPQRRKPDQDMDGAPTLRRTGPVCIPLASNRRRRSTLDTTVTDDSISVTPADSIATSVPVPMAMPTSAEASAGASFTPSPTMATISPSAWRALTAAALPWSSGCSGGR